MKTAVGQSVGSLSRAGGSYPTPPIGPQKSLLPAASLSGPPFSNPGGSRRRKEEGRPQQAQLGVAGQVWVGAGQMCFGAEEGLDWTGDWTQKGKGGGLGRRVRWEDVTSGDWSPTLPGRSTLKSVSPIKHVIPNTPHLISKLLSKQVKVGWNLASMNLHFCITTFVIKTYV